MQNGARVLRFMARLRPFRDQVGIPLFLVLATGLLIGPSSGGTALAASPFNVNSMTDATDASIDGVCASATGACTLRAAIQEANAAADCSTNPQQTMQTINVPADTYNLDLSVPSVPACTPTPPATICVEGEDNGATGDLDIKTHVTINGAGAQATIVDARQNDRVLDVFSGCTVRIVGISTTNGRITLGGSVGAGIQNHGKLTLDSVIVSNNVAGTTLSLSGGGIYNHQLADLTLLQVVVSNNGATNLSAGIENGGSLKAYYSTIKDNKTIVLGGRGSAGGIQNTSGGTAEIIGSTVSGNEGWRGGGIYLDSGSMTLVNSTISGNVANEEGGAIYASSDFRIVNSTVALNTSGARAAPLCGATCPSIYMNSGTATFRSTIIDQGASGCGASTGSFVSEGFNLDRGTSCGLAMRLNLCPPAPAGGDRQNVAGPMLGPLMDNGGFTQTHALLHRPGPLVVPNPAVDGVPANYAPSTDQRGTARPQFPPCTSPPCNYAPCGYFTDVGAYEVVQ